MTLEFILIFTQTVTSISLHRPFNPGKVIHGKSLLNVNHPEYKCSRFALTGYTNFLTSSRHKCKHICKQIFGSKICRSFSWDVNSGMCHLMGSEHNYKDNRLVNYGSEVMDAVTMRGVTSMSDLTALRIPKHCLERNKFYTENSPKPAIEITREEYQLIDGSKISGPALEILDSTQCKKICQHVNNCKAYNFIRKTRNGNGSRGHCFLMSSLKNLPKARCKNGYKCFSGLNHS